MTETSYSEATQYQMTVLDRCDACGQQAYLWVKGVSGELMFCRHHYEGIINKPEAKEKLDAFAFEIIDETDKIR